MPELTQPALRANIITASGMTDANVDALNQRGFPDYMIWSFLLAAEQDNTIVSSRLPGGVGLDLIEAGYDLKGFQIKAKSCDWGPMAGFICQLPFLNKAGYEKIAYNTRYIIDYLTALDRFSPKKVELKEIEDALKKVTDVLSPIKITSTGSLHFELSMAKLSIEGELELQFGSGILSSDEQNIILNLLDSTKYNELNAIEPSKSKIAQIRTAVFKIYHLKLGVLKTDYRNVEQQSAEWSGENSLTPADKSPFIALNRRFSAVAATAAQDLALMTGVVHAEALPNDTIIGTAVNDGTEVNSTIKVDFILEKVAGSTAGDDGKVLWAIYYEKIYYREKSNASNFALTPDYINELTSAEQGKLKIKPKLRKIKGNEKVDDYEKYQAAAEKAFTDGLKRIYSKTGEGKAIGDRTGYPIYGIMNPHPPFAATIGVTKTANTEFYKNAVSGDFDLFAFWPYKAIQNDDLVRLSERYMGKVLSWPINTDLLFYLEFIPGFDELVDKNKENLRESAEEGNIHNLGRSVAGWLNCFAMQTYAKLYAATPAPAVPAVRSGTKVAPVDKKYALNKAFHSDEGGRPGIMEVEFPIAVFFPAKPPTTVLNARAGLINNPSEFLQLILDCNSGADKYRIMMHSEWMIHLFYISLSKPERGKFLVEDDEFLDQQLLVPPHLPREFFTELRKRDAKGEEIPQGNFANDTASRAAAISEYMKDNFIKLEKHHAEMYGPEDERFARPEFVRKLRDELLQVTVSTFVNLQLKFLALAFQSDWLASKRLTDIQTIFSATE